MIGARGTFETDREPTGMENNLDKINQENKQSRSTGVSQRALAANTTTGKSWLRNFKNEGRGLRKGWETSGMRT